jgi:mediator of RNA polymerase II transcription subunit 31
MDLEFIQCLSNPQYLQFLAQQRILQEECFINYLEYLQYFQDPQYSKYVVFPYCLQLLDYLMQAPFREALASAETANFLHEKQYKHWEFYKKSHTIEKADPSILKQ